MPEYQLEARPVVPGSATSSPECKQLRLRVKHLEADVECLQQRKVHLEKENEALVAADQESKAKLAEALEENERLKALLVTANSEEQRKRTEMEAQQADIASSFYELQSMFEQFTKSLEENELGAKLWRSAKSKHIAATVRRQMDKHGHLDSTSPLWDDRVRLRLGSDPHLTSRRPSSSRLSSPQQFQSLQSRRMHSFDKPPPESFNYYRESHYIPTRRSQDRAKSQGCAHRRRGAGQAHQRRGAGRSELHSSPAPKEEECDSPQAANSNDPMKVFEDARANRKQLLEVTRSLAARMERVEAARPKLYCEATTPSCGKHQELNEVYDALEREAKRSDRLVDRSCKQDLADARRYLRQGDVDMYPGSGEILADWSSVLDKIKDRISTDLCDVVHRELLQLRQALGSLKQAENCNP
mmetsp:Transcript_105160/g.165957  ORF Transcript_105160/g.165957 Transcript_105160/m.165957 type:complete len:414 (-) Transcript_105160:12-1253(-)